MNHDEADRYVELYDEINKWLPQHIHQSDQKIALDCEKEFGIPADKILEQFKGENSMCYNTAGLIMLACSDIGKEI